MTKGQERAFDTLWDFYGLESDKGNINIERSFRRVAPVILEIGFGMGDSLIQQAISEPQYNFLGIEVHKPGVGRLMSQAERLGASNIRVFCADAVEILENVLGPRSLDGVQIYFPDPWHKKRHHKRRLIQPEFLDLLAYRVKMNGFCHCVTDWAPYAKSMLDSFAQCTGWHRTPGNCNFVKKPLRRPTTKFETRGKKLGHTIFDLIYQRSRLD